MSEKQTFSLDHMTLIMWLLTLIMSQLLLRLNMADPFARISSMLESARDLTIEAAVSASTRLAETPMAKRPQEILKLLNSRVDRDVLNGMKCVMALIARGEDGSEYFADVVKNVTLLSARIKALVLIYLLKYAEHEPDTALLLINSIQKLLGDKKPAARAALIRTLGGIKIPEIASLLLLCIKRTCSDLLPQVRAATAIAIGKAYGIAGINKAQLGQLLATLLGDSSPIVVGSAIKVHFKLQPQLKKAWTPLHSNFRRYTRMISDLDEWAQCFMVETLTEYSRLFLPKPYFELAGGSVEFPDISEFPESYRCVMDADLKLFVECLRPLVFSRSGAVILSVAKALVLVTTPEHVAEFRLPLVLTKLVTLGSGPIRLYALQMVLAIALTSPASLETLYRKFYVCPGDSIAVASHKLRILAVLASESTSKQIVQELQYCALQSHRLEIAQEAIKAIGQCSRTSSYWTDRILRWCSVQIGKVAPRIVGELLTVIRLLLQQKQSSGGDRQEIVRTIYRLSLILQRGIRLDQDARATIIWIIGEFTEVSQNTIGPDVLRQSLKLFVHESEKVRYELLILAAKVYLFELLTGHTDTEALNNSTIGKMFHHAMQLARYDAVFDTRDRARMLEQLLSRSNSQLATLFLQAPKPAPIVSTYSSSVDPVLSRYLESEPWAKPETLPPKTIRRESTVPLKVTSMDNSSNFGESSSTGVVGSLTSAELVARISAPIQQGKPYKLQSLDEFFGNEEDDVDSDTDEGTSDTSSEESEFEDSEESEVSQDETASNTRPHCAGSSSAVAFPRAGSSQERDGNIDESDSDNSTNSKDVFLRR